MIKYPSIDQFRNAIGDVHRITRREYGKRDATGELVEDQQRTWKFPPVEFSGTVKLHGTNASVVISADDVSYQSRNRVLTLDYDNAGFAAWAGQFEDLWRAKARDGQLVIYGEWCGGAIQKGVALTGLPLMFVVFEAWHIVGDVTTFLDLAEVGALPPSAYLITDFPTWKISIDMENPQLSQNELVGITMGVEAECPVGKHFGVCGVGEGVVWTADLFGERIRFKVKGEKHSTHRVRTLAAVNVEGVGTLNEFVENALTDARLSQGLDYLREQGLPITLASTGDYIRWVIGDVFKEDADIIATSGLDGAAVRKRIGSTAAIRYKAIASYPLAA